MRLFITMTAAIALATSGAAAQPGKNDEKRKGPPAAAVEKGNKPDKAERGKDWAKAEKAERKAIERQGKAWDKAEKAERKAIEQRDKAWDKARKEERKAIAGARRDRREAWDDGRDRGLFRDHDRRLGFVEGCPPGLAKKYNGCRPPGQAKKQAGYSPAWFGYRDYRDGRFIYDDGHLLRLGDNGLIGAILPLLGGALGIGNVWPSYYNEPVRLPRYTLDYYGLQPDEYRYANNTIYRVDPETAAITSIAALLTGDEFVVGQPAPAGYDVYNVPYAYRDRYRDGPDALYRYSDGYVYRLDPETRLVAAAIELALS